MSRDALLMVFVKNPVLGRVKTRLAKEVGRQKALAIYQQLFSHTQSITKQVQVPKLVYYSDRLPEPNPWESSDYQVTLQPTGDLGQRMAAAFKENLEQYNRVVIIGSDNPELTPNNLEVAFEKLKQKDIVIGPAKDGGYYLLGMKAFHASLFQDITWSTDRVFKQTLAQIHKANLSYYTLPEQNDIDTYQDWLEAPWKH